MLRATADDQRHNGVPGTTIETPHRRARRAILRVANRLEERKKSEGAGSDAPWGSVPLLPPSSGPRRAKPVRSSRSASSRLLASVAGGPASTTHDPCFQRVQSVCNDPRADFDERWSLTVQAVLRESLHREPQERGSLLWPQKRGRHRLGSLRLRFHDITSAYGERAPRTSRYVAISHSIAVNLDAT